MTQPVGRLHAAISRRILHLPDAAGPLTGHTADTGADLTVLFVGDSSIAGVGAAHHEEALAGRLSAALAARTGHRVHWRVLARSGDTVRGLTDLVSRAEPGHADAVVISAGVNDVLRCRWPSRWRHDVAGLVTAVRELVGAPVPVLTVGLPPVHRILAIPALIRWSLGGYAALLDRELVRLCAGATDVTHLPTSPFPTDTSGFFSADRFHPSATGYGVWADILAAHAEPVIGRVPLSVKG